MFGYQGGESTDTVARKTAYRRCKAAVELSHDLGSVADPERGAARHARKGPLQPAV
jgi:hypothetical protein